MAQLISITSEALQATIRRLLPSQQGFGEDLQASNVVTPIIDLTPSAQGADTPEDLRRSFGYRSITTFAVSNTTSTLVNTTGFYQVIFSVSAQSPGQVGQADFFLTDGATAKKLLEMQFGAGQDVFQQSTFNVFLEAGISLTARTTRSDIKMAGSTQQFADVTGNLVTPTGFNPE